MCRHHMLSAAAAAAHAASAAVYMFVLRALQLCESSILQLGSMARLCLLYVSECLHCHPPA